MATILLGDNRGEDLRSWGDVLKGAGYKVLKASSLGQARKYLESGKPDLAILDLHWIKEDDMTDWSGFDLAADFAAYVPCILFTSLADQFTVRDLMRKGNRGEDIADVVFKQEPARKLLEAVRRNLLPRVFVAHGHDGEAKLSVVNFLQKRRTRPVVIRDLPSEGKTIIEMIERYSNVHYAVVLLTPDDMGCMKEDLPKINPRARQNVIMELGFFLGRLGRSRVAALVKTEKDIMEIPSDYQGIKYISMDAGDKWKDELSEEMNKAGIIRDIV